ncbi:MAG: tryptophan-rich sensory protein [Oscillospiraceae bacterium]|nr:tryptophan-rich sensory protein [Oscillospiraceae bacterium]
MRRKKILSYIIWLVISLAAGGLSSIAAARGMPTYQLLQKPFLTPPAILFPIVWFILYVLMGIGAGRIWNSRDCRRSSALVFFVVQLAVNALWTLFFFGLQLHLLSFLWLVALWILIAVMIRSFSRIDRIAGRLQIPYLLWTAFAGYLNCAFWLLNR